jgi:hypothetical protein
MLSRYRRVVAVDFEFTARPGDRPEPVCCVVRDVRSGDVSHHWLADGAPASPPYDTSSDTLFVAYYASAELGCHLALGWPMPARILDLYAEFRCLTSGLPTPCGHGLLGALAYHGLDAIEAAEKEEMRALAMRGGPYSKYERNALLSYCQSDVDSLARLLAAMLPLIDLPRALLRGRYMAAAARMEWAGVPLDAEALVHLLQSWESIKGRLITAVDKDYGVFVPSPKAVGGSLTFSSARFAAYLSRKGIPWPRLESGALALDDDTFKEMARSRPAEIGPMREVLRIHRGELKRIELTVGCDGRNRYLLSAFGSRTGRNQPSNTRSIFGPASWLRSLIKPGPGRAVAYCDWSAQELAIAAVLSGDRNMLDAYGSGDPYVYLARKAGVVPADATKHSHPAEREQFKVVSLGVLYGLSADGLARKLNVPPCRGRELLRMHQETFSTFWCWSDRVEMEAMLTGSLRTVFGWSVHLPKGADPKTGQSQVNPRSLRNFPMQGNGAEMMRLACCLATERGITVCAPIHDALLVESDAGDIDEVVSRTKEAMLEASRVVLGGFEVRVEAKVVRHPDRYSDGRGRRMWEEAWRLLEEADEEGCLTAETGCLTSETSPLISYSSSPYLEINGGAGDE